ncbi:hypothetical protein [Microbacterium sp. VKM Ac-2923]|uniref:hypothetical protein n=1 Tax=Microbacterium sp. VKM Ac-2923 TaxID=2929476 RepID=UPI001FB4C7F1|nr:hypothetical protein [Microbacterium sp. VKM Ac-2923]MCJ1706404.1 hypothetical protein [Microbacterium sp. VKM Ac-2923]
MRIRTILPATAVLLAALVSVPFSASAATPPSVVGEPSTVSLGETTTITASGLGGLETATFGIDDTDAGAFSGDGVESSETTVAVPVTQGTAVVEFTPTRSGDIVIAVGTGESVLAQATIAVSAATAEPAPAAPTPSTTTTPSAGDDSAQAAPDPEAETGRLTFVLIPLIAAAVVVAGGIFVITRGRRKRRGD